MLATSGPSEALQVSATTPEENMVATEPVSSEQAPANPDVEEAAPVSATVEVSPGAKDEGRAQLRPLGGSTGPDGVGSRGIRGEPPPTCEPGAGSCFLPNGSPGCDHIDCCSAVCDLDDFCCIYDWDAQCVQYAWENCEPPTDLGACCDKNDDCLGIVPEDDCDGQWYQGRNCEQIVCSNAGVDLCPGEVIEIGLSIIGSTIGATIDLGFPWCGTSITAPGVWYTVIGNGHTITVTTCNSITDYDSKINVYCSSCADPTCVGGNDDSCAEFTYRSTVTWCSELGAEYYILVQGYGGVVGNFQLDIVDQGSCDDPASGCTSQDCGNGECEQPLENCDDCPEDCGDCFCGNGTCDSDEDCAGCEEDCGPCPGGACCDGFACSDTTELNCPHTWFEGEQCATFQCPFGACCEDAECLGNTSHQDCVGDWHFGEDCATFECPEGEYCRPCYADMEDDYITNVTFVTIDNTTGQEGACSYRDYTHLSTTVEPGSTHQISVSFFSEGNWRECVKVWVDWNRNYEFEASESYYLACGVETTLTGDIDVPEDAAPGCTRMRVIEEYSNEPVNACNTETPTAFGEAEDYSVCTVAACPAGEVEWLDPPDNVVDAGVPSDIHGGPLLGIDRIRVSAPAGAGATCFTLCEDNDGGFGPNSIVDVTDNGDGSYTIDLSRPLTPMAVTTITYTGTNATGRFTSHPANANADGWAGPIDILSVIDHLNGVHGLPHGLYSADVDRSGVVDAADIQAVIDLLNGVDVFPPYLETALPVNTDCP